MNDFIVNDAAAIEAIRVKAAAERNDELHGGIESVVFALERGLIFLPVTLRLPVPPAADAMILSAGTKAFGVEVTRVGWSALTQVRNEAAAKGDFLVEIDPHLLADCQAKPDKGAPKGTRSGDFAAIREPSEGLRGEGMTGGQARAATLRALRAAIDRKVPKPCRYRSYVGQVWLFLIADGLIANWEDILTRPDLTHVKNEVQALCAGSGFERVLLWVESKMVTPLK